MTVYKMKIHFNDRNEMTPILSLERKVRDIENRASAIVTEIREKDWGITQRQAKI